MKSQPYRDESSRYEGARAHLNEPFEWFSEVDQ